MLQNARPSTTPTQEAEEPDGRQRPDRASNGVDTGEQLRDPILRSQSRAYREGRGCTFRSTTARGRAKPPTWDDRAESRDLGERPPGLPVTVQELGQAFSAPPRAPSPRSQPHAHGRRTRVACQHNPRPPHHRRPGLAHCRPDTSAPEVRMVRCSGALPGTSRWPTARLACGSSGTARAW